MKFSVKIEFDGKYVVGYVPQLAGCYAQAFKIQDLSPLMKFAIEMYRDNYKMRMEPFTPETEKPKFKESIKFNSMSADQLGSYLRKYAYTRESSNKYFHLYRKSSFPFDRIIIPNSSEISPLIIKKLFGAENVTVIKSQDNELKFSGQA
jgi:predicted RNase H-like HicB family nuclease